MCGCFKQWGRNSTIAPERRSSRQGTITIFKLVKNIIIVLAVALALCSCTVNEEASTSEAEKMVERFFLNYEKQGPKASLKAIISSNKYISAAVADTVSVKLERLANGLGHYQGYEKVADVKYGESIFLLTYVVKYTQQPLRFKFKFYQPGNGLRLQNFSFESEFLDEIEELIKAEGVHQVEEV